MTPRTRVISNMAAPKEKSRVLIQPLPASEYSQAILTGCFLSEHFTRTLTPNEPP